MEKKPLLYESACIFSILGSAIGFVGAFASTFFFQSVTKKITRVTNITATEKLTPFYFAIFGALFCVSLIGAIKLFRMQRSGLYFYLPAQILLMLVPVWWLGSNAFSSINAIFTLLFSVVYLYYFRITK
jgi:hypothetical protein